MGGQEIKIVLGEVKKNINQRIEKTHQRFARLNKDFARVKCMRYFVTSRVHS